MNKDDIQENLIEIGRNIVKEKGPDFLTARKLSEASGYSVGTIYNQFGNMDNFVLIQNYMTLDMLYRNLLKVEYNNPYEKLNEYVHVFTEFVSQNRFLWHMFFNFHLNCTNRYFSVTYLKRVSVIILLIEKSFKDMFKDFDVKKRRVFMEVLWINIFSFSSLLTTSALENYSKIEPTKICQVLLNTYLAGVKVSERIE